MNASADTELAFADEIGGPICGIDEAGRGAWAGPVVAAAVICGDVKAYPEDLADSKTLREARREHLFDLLSARQDLRVGVGVASVAEIDRMGVGKANWLAMARAVKALPSPPLGALVDGNYAPALPCPDIRPIVKGDGSCLVIAAASIVAKVTRDRIMRSLCPEHPAYRWSANKGYPAPVHRAALEEIGPSAHHRHSFAPIAALDDRHAS
ncbi:ribonuclease HII [Parvularcula bermudensis HTCC2503]|uniref:Ribonuclease HII n=1 Tax=Parvularcula bermudensis (strain ATCC BAA-594 / HTCC2503 / KCTC 12087) TaxID=314260 RepID=E0TC64_PARBH|nr:ribonuclease HII [Parvularcula bermudensis]ADM08497.1 ribonuclease HII [Parvularcula bermudensis HTCC2503]